MISYTIKRLLTLIPTLIGITLITFFIMKIVPGDPVTMKLMFAQTNLAPDKIEAIIKSETPAVVLPEGYEKFSISVSHLLHKDGESHEQATYKVLHWVGENTFFYAHWFKGIASFNFGYSSKDKQPVTTKIARALPITLLINLVSLIIIYLVALPLGIWSARHRNSPWDRIVMIKLFFWYAIPSFWVASLLLMYLAGGEYLNLFPLMGLISDNHAQMGFLGKLGDITWHLTLPVFVTVVGGLAYLTRFVRNNFLDVLNQDFMRTARAKGLSENAVIYKHGLRNALIPFVTLVGMLIPGLLGGSVIVEQIFNIPGMGMLSFEAVLSRDHNVIMGITVLGAFMTLLGLLISDLLYRCVDPRVKLE